MNSETVLESSNNVVDGTSEGRMLAKGGKEGIDARRNRRNGGRRGDEVEV